MLLEFFQKINELGEPFVWKPIQLAPHSNEAKFKLTNVVFGECGQGKSTDLSLIAEIYVKKYCAGEKHTYEFKSGKSATAVTTTVKPVQIGNMTLIDTPGSNDPDQKRQDKQVQIEFVSTVRPVTKTKHQGVGTIT